LWTRIIAGEIFRENEKVRETVKKGKSFRPARMEGAIISGIEKAY
jgi:hypothetical protein